LIRPEISSTEKCEPPMMTADDIRNWLKLTPNPQEGGFLTGVYESSIRIPDEVLKGFAPTKNGRSICGAIYYFLDATGCSVLHKVTGDMLYHFYCGDPVQMLLLFPAGSPNNSELCVFGNNLELGQSPMKMIPGGTWLGSRLMLGGSWALMGVTMAPGFDSVDYAIGQRKELIREYPQQEALIIDLTRDD
jgi:predicted cupin superfamily sugar epimerase